MAKNDPTGFPGSADQAGRRRGGGSSTRQRLLVVLKTRHQYLPTVADAIATVGQRLRNRVSNDRVEYAVLVDDRTGAQLGGERGVVRGNVEEVVLEPLLVKREQGRRYVCVHTHPHSMPVSLFDA